MHYETDEDIADNIFHYIFGRWQWYRRWVGGKWQYSTLTNNWWKIVKCSVEEDYEDKIEVYE